MPPIVRGKLPGANVCTDCMVDLACLTGKQLLASPPSPGWPITEGTGWQAAPGLPHCSAPMFLPSPLCPLTAAKIAGLQATVLLLIILLIKARVQIKAASTLGLFLLALQTLVFLAASGALGLAAIAAGGFALNCRQTQTA